MDGFDMLSLSSLLFLLLLSSGSSAVICQRALEKSGERQGEGAERPEEREERTRPHDSNGTRDR